MAGANPRYCHFLLTPLGTLSYIMIQFQCKNFGLSKSFNSSVQDCYFTLSILPWEQYLFLAMTILQWPNCTFDPQRHISTPQNANHYFNSYTPTVNYGVNFPRTNSHLTIMTPPCQHLKCYFSFHAKQSKDQPPSHNYNTTLSIPQMVLCIPCWTILRTMPT
jgi:hypothetical protein